MKIQIGVIALLVCLCIYLLLQQKKYPKIISAPCQGEQLMFRYDERCDDLNVKFPGYLDIYEVDFKGEKGLLILNKK